MNGMDVNVGIGLLVDDIELLFGCRVESFTGEPETFPCGIRNFYVKDPEGNLLEIGSTGKGE